MNFKRLHWADHVVQMGNTRTPKNYLMEKSMEEDMWVDHG